ncbi:30S ribosomal protein S17e [Candidatus Woesearchaeota archaeon]|nr:30S ribosomal protein S17e [Candidatus Woesearchaeota archaeon]
MGRIKTKQIKRITHELLEEYGSTYKKDFRENRMLVEQHADISSKKLKNTIAGYVTRLVKGGLE